MATSHRQARYRPTLRRWDRGVFAVDQWYHMVSKLLFEEIEGQFGMLRMVPVDDLVIRDRNDHRLGFPFGEKVVHDEVDPAVVDPVGRQFTAPADEVKNRIPAARIVAWRRVNVDLALSVRYI